MAVKRVVDTGFWTDGKHDEFSPEDKYFMLYLLTNPFCRQLGIYKISIKQAAFQMGYSVDAFSVLLDRFENKYKVILFSKETNEVAIMNFLRHSVIKGGKPVEDCIKQDIQQVKNKKLIEHVFLHLDKRDDLNATVRKVIDEYLNGNDIHNDNDNDRTGDDSSDDSPDDTAIREEESLIEACKETIELLNQKAGTKYRHNTKKTKTHIHARLAEGYTLDDFKLVIDKKCAEWIGTEFEQYLRPETLFGPKFENYLNARVNNRNTKAATERMDDLDGIF